MRLFKMGLAVAVLVAAYKAGVALGQARKLAPVIDVKLAVPFPSPKENFLEAIETLKRESYNDDLNDEILYHAALKGILRHLSPENQKEMLELWPPELAKAKAEQATGKLASIGVHLTTQRLGKELHLIVDDIIPNTPAAKAGFKLRDNILAIDGVTVDGLTFAEAEAKLHRSTGTVIALTIQRSADILNLSASCEEYRARDVRSRRIKEFGLLRINEFSDGVQVDLPKEAASLRKSGARGLVIDLRGNPGGVVDVAWLAACGFLAKRAVPYQSVGRNRELTPRPCPKKGDIRTPLVLLTDARTVSSAELFTAAMKENQRAAVIGATTKGYGAVKQVHKLPNGHSFTFITDVLHGPRGESWLGRGVAPDKESSIGETELQDIRLEDDEDKVLARDKPLAQAVELLRAR